MGVRLEEGWFEGVEWGVGGCVYILFDVIHFNQPKFPCRFHRSFFYASLPCKYGFLDYSRVV